MRPLPEGSQAPCRRTDMWWWPTVTVLAVMKARLVGAVKGHALLKKKADALTVRCVRFARLHAWAARGRTSERKSLMQGALTARAVSRA